MDDVSLRHITNNDWLFVLISKDHLIPQVSPLYHLIGDASLRRGTFQEKQTRRDKMDLDYRDDLWLEPVKPTLLLFHLGLELLFSHAIGDAQCILGIIMEERVSPLEREDTKT